MGSPIEAPDSTAEFVRCVNVNVADLECYVNFAAVLAESGQKAGPI